MMKRKIIKQGNNTLTVTLPREWTDSHQIKPGDELSLELKNNKLILSTDNLISFEKKTKDISKLTSILPSVLISLYRKGYDEVELTFEKPQTLIVIQQVLLHTGYHMVDQGKTNCLLKSLTEVNDVNFNDILRKLFIHVKMKLEAISLVLQEQDAHELHSIIAMNGVPSKITNFCHRLISKGNYSEPEKLHYAHLILNDIENLDSYLNHLIHQLLQSSFTINSRRLVDCILEFNRLYSEFYSSYFESNVDNFVAVLHKKKHHVRKYKFGAR